MHENYLHAGYYQNKFSEAQNQQFAQVFDAITKKMVAALESGESFDSAAMQQAVKEHYEFCLRFWKPNRESYKSLAMSFILPTEYRETYEGYREGLGKYIFDAISHFADTNLS
ncbi:MAG: TipAS antibiotic-recognition domain-containing protein [Actinobacteria bacterium]|nr:TipAS antibiotic-recognition domain-containing protein [Actinomycetota bacterium]